MGIGNSPIDGVDVGFFKLITPHGDRELATARLASTADQLITPHGDREQEPQMMIPDRCRLITPHGDRERASRKASRGRSWQLITPHGDRELACNRRIERETVASLPLMGIGNLRCNPALANPLSSLPLMGIGNHRFPRHRRTRWTTHYPSWGSGTRSCRADNGGVRLLITPHGDREPSCAALSDAGMFHSLPLMGIGNTTHRTVARSTAPLITPHGDRERGRGGGAVRGVQLITPHGDREPCPRCTSDSPVTSLITPHGDREPRSSTRG